MWVMYMGYPRSVWVSAASFFYWVGHCISLTLDGLQVRQMLDMHVISSGACFPHPYPTVNLLEKGVDKRGQANPNLPSHVGNKVIEAFLSSRCLLELTAVLKHLGFGESLA